MKHTHNIIIALLLSAAPAFVSAQEKLPQEEALQYAAVVGKDAKQLNGTPIRTEVDLEQPVVLREGDYGGMLLPQKNLKADSLAQAGEGVVPVGQLWLLKLGPVKDGSLIAREQLRVVTVKHAGEETEVLQCALGVQKAAGGKLELLVYGKGKEPILRLPLKSTEGAAGTALDASAEVSGDEANLTVKILGKYQATLVVTELQL
jgi:hypothetical protein